VEVDDEETEEVGEELDNGETTGLSTRLSGDWTYSASGMEVKSTGSVVARLFKLLSFS